MSSAEETMSFVQHQLAPDVAAVLALFDPSSVITRKALAELRGLPAKPVDPSAKEKFASILAIGPTPRTFGPWTSEPSVIGDVLLLRLRKFREGSAAPKVREAAESVSLAVFDFATERVFAPESQQYHFEEPEWCTEEECEALYAGAFLVHNTFGKGRLLDIGTYKGMPTFVIKFADRGHLISVEHGLPHLRRISAAKS